MRKIPTSIATQHPDNAAAPFWQSKPFVSSAAEIEESYICFSDLGIDEYNWDWEGKFVDEAVVDRLLHRYYKYFQKNILGEGKFLTFRIPNPRIEKQFRLARAFMVAITSSQLAQSLGFKNSPIFETILPLTETAQEIIDIQEAFRDLVGVEHALLKMKDSIQNIEIIPLFEQVDKIMASGEILKEYISFHKKRFGVKPEYIRPYCARSDPALNSGLIPTMLAVKVALSQYRLAEKESGVRFFPMVGTGSLPFRGGLTPTRIDESLENYAGVSTFTVQSAFRYDYPKSLVKKAVDKLKLELPQKRARILSSSDIKRIQKVIPFFEKQYRESIEKGAGIINSIARQFPKRRERLQHIGLFGYSRGVGRVKLPRAIVFTGALYSLGIPPEIIGTGRGIETAQKNGLWDIVSSTYTHLRDDLQEAGHFLNKENVARLAKDNPGWYEVLSDISLIEKELGVELGPINSLHREHYNISSKVYQRSKKKKEFSQLITEAGKLRKSLG